MAVKDLSEDVLGMKSPSAPKLPTPPSSPKNTVQNPINLTDTSPLKDMGKEGNESNTLRMSPNYNVHHFLHRG